MRAPFPITDRPIRFALVGCGRIAASHVEALKRHAGRAELDRPVPALTTANATCR